MSRVRRVLKTAKWFLILLVALVIVFFVTIMPWVVATITTTNRFHFPDPNDGKTPTDFGMQYESIEFHSSDGIDLKGWWMPASGQAAGTVIYVHGQNRTREEMMPMAQYGHNLGYNGLAFDLRHHGTSSGNVSSVGYWERLDVEAAVRHALNNEHATRPIVLWGVSLGAAASLLAAAETPEVAAVISDSSFLSFDDTARHHWKLFFSGWPSFPMYDETIWLITRRAHFKALDFDLRKAVERINPRPILFIGVEGDRRMPPDVARALYAASSSPDKMLLIVPGTRHGEGFHSGNAQYEQAVKEFLNRVPAGH
jgi:fermentation-respiration switch protein FrsA (DUF1100 family)